MKLFNVPITFLCFLSTTTVGSRATNGPSRSDSISARSSEFNDLYKSQRTTKQVQQTTDDGGYEAVCPSDYLYLRSSVDVDGEFEVFSSAFNREDQVKTIGPLQRRQQLRRRRRRSNQDLVVSRRTKIQRPAPPITIVRQSGSYVDFRIQNSTWFGAAATASNNNSKGVVDDNGSSILPPPLHIFTVVPADKFGSEQCILSENLIPVNVASSDTIRAYCSVAASGGSSTIVRVYTRFDDDIDHAADNNQTRMGIGATPAEVPECCNDPYNANNAKSNYLGNPSYPRDALVVEYVFELHCSPTCTNPNNYFDDTTMTDHYHTIDDDDEKEESSSLLSRRSTAMHKYQRTVGIDEPLPDMVAVGVVAAVMLTAVTALFLTPNSARRPLLAVVAASGIVVGSSVPIFFAGTLLSWLLLFGWYGDLVGDL